MLRYHFVFFVPNYLPIFLKGPFSKKGCKNSFFFSNFSVLSSFLEKLGLLKHYKNRGFIKFGVFVDREVWTVLLISFFCFRFLMFFLRATSLGPEPSFLLLFFLLYLSLFLIRKTVFFSPLQGHFCLFFEFLPLFLLSLFGPSPFFIPLSLSLSLVLFFLPSFLSLLVFFGSFFVSFIFFFLLCFCFMKRTT